MHKMTITQALFNNRWVKYAWYFTRKHVYCPRALIDVPPKRPESLVWGTGRQEDQSRAPVPQIIWSFWEGPMSASVSGCIKSWQAHCPEFDINVLSTDTIFKFIPDFPVLNEGVPIVKISDLVRLMLLEHYGGIWIDASTLITRSLTDILNQQEIDQSEVVAFYTKYPKLFRFDERAPVIEASFLSARRGSKFISRWREEYSRCISDSNWKTYYTRRKDYSLLSAHFVKKDITFHEYLVTYIASQKTMMESSDYRLTLFDSDDILFFLRFHTRKPTKGYLSAEALLKHEPELPVIVKLIGVHRDIVDEYIRYGCYSRKSALGKYLQ